MGDDSDVVMREIPDPKVDSFELKDLDPSSSYLFKVIAQTAAGDGPAIERISATLLEGGETTQTSPPPSFIPNIPST